MHEVNLTAISALPLYVFGIAIVISLQFKMGVLLGRFIPICSLFNLLVCCSCLLLLHPGSSSARVDGPSRLGGNVTDHLALLAIKAHIKNDPRQLMSSWNESIHFCKWQGVTCGRRHQRVTVLDLQSQQLVGSISQHIGNLSFLKGLLLQNNGFSLEIPQEISRLHRLQRLRLDNNSITGEIPANISRCSSLINLTLGGNRLEGKIPTELGSLSNLQRLILGRNNLTGDIPPSLGNLSSLEIFDAYENNLLGSVPDSLGRLKNLVLFWVDSNRLSGNIPPSIYNISGLQVFSIFENQFEGRLPSDMGNTLSNIQYIVIAFNQFTGSIPASISNASNLKQLILASNQLTGPVPSLQKLSNMWEFDISMNHLGSGEAGDFRFLSDLTNATGLGLLGIGVNNFGGMLPTYISNLSTNLAALSIQGNQIYGRIPTGVGNLINLQMMEMGNNQFTGNIPTDIGRLLKLGQLGFENNKLSGNIPSSLGNLTMLSKLGLQGNNLQGSIPSSLGNCRNLLQLDLSENNLSGVIPPQVIGLSSLAISLFLSGNNLSGFLPMEVGNLEGLRLLDISDNMLSGELPSSLGRCKSLEYLYLEGNFFQGTIPSSLISLRGIQDLDLSRNNFSGKIPQYLEGFDLNNLNLSFNDFEGVVPVGGVFKNASATSIVGNSKLCGGIPEFQLPRCNFKESQKRRSTHSLKLIISTVCGVLGITLVLSLLFLCSLRKKKNKKPSSSTSGNSILQVSYRSLLKATSGFSSTNLIGVGSFGSVYKGILEHDGTIIAVKVFNLLHRGASKSFIAECEALRNIKHRNLVKIITACSSVDFHGNDFKALVYEFMVNGSLEEWLHPTIRIAEARETSVKLSLLQRLNIAIDVACALDYLHHHCQTPIVHCDLKPSNVLLDSEMTGHVADFGLAKFLSEVTNNFSANQSSSIGVRGSVGYAAPEYGMGSEVSTYGDVYSFGILLMEIFTGKRPTDDMFTDSLNLPNFVKMALPERVKEIIPDLELQGGEGEGETSTRTNNTPTQHRVRTHKIEECLISIFRIGIACSAESPGERMDISVVAANLHSIRDTLLGIGMHGDRPTPSTI